MQIVTHELQLCAGGQINNDDSANDVKVVDLTKVGLSRLSLNLPHKDAGGATTCLYRATSQHQCGSHFLSSQLCGAHMSTRSAAAQVHNLSGPIEITDTQGEPAHPGDLLVVEILNLGALEGDEWGFTGTFDRENGGMHPCY